MSADEKSELSNIKNWHANVDAFAKYFGAKISAKIALAAKKSKKGAVDKDDEQYVLEETRGRGRARSSSGAFSARQSRAGQDRAGLGRAG